ncbi:MAG: outer membrane protein assembly factor BamA, partial [Deltaproteobacteria bacterium]|nr:outer membrane protein assembly factor BamA [Deltaproteobacteria bacterium]
MLIAAVSLPALAQDRGLPPTGAPMGIDRDRRTGDQQPGPDERPLGLKHDTTLPKVEVVEADSTMGQPAPPTGTLVKVRVQGNRRVETDAIKAVLPIKPGDTYDKAKLSATVLAVWRMSYFSDVQLDVSPVPVPEVGYALTVIVVEKPAIREVRLEGNEEISKDDLKDTIEVKQYQILDMEAVRRSAKKVQEKYVEKGYFLAEVTPRTELQANNEIDVILVVNEHAKVQVKEIRFVGNKTLSTAELKATMITQEGNFFSALTGNGTYREDAFARDEYMLQGAYYDHGFLYVKFNKPVIELSPDKRFIYITMSVEEGDPYDIGKIDVSGDMLESKETLASMIVIKPGERFSRSGLTKDMQALSDVYKDKGYAYANVSPLTAVDAEKKTVDVTFEMQKGNIVHIEKIEVLGNSKTRDKVIRRELRINEGDLYSSTAIRRSKQRVTALGFFETVEINQRRGSSDDLMVLEVSIKEKLTGTFQVGFGFTGGESFFGTAQLSQNNLMGYGHTASLSLQLSSIRQLFQVSYLDPYLWDTPFNGSLDLYRSQLAYTGFERNSFGGAATLGYEILEDLRVFATYTLEQVDVNALGTSAQILKNQFLSGRTSSMRFSFNYDKRDNRLFPSDGNLISASAEYASSIFDSQNLFQRYKIIERFYHPLGYGLVFKTNINFGYIRSTDPVNRPVAISEKFFEGGINSIRGYVLRTISPTKRVAT